MSEIITQFDVEAPPASVWDALTTAEGIRGWWTTQAEVASGEETVVKVRFPDAPMSWDLRVDETVANERLRWHCVGGPPPWIDTDLLFQIGDAPDGGTRVLFDHAGWKDAEDGPGRDVRLGGDVPAAQGLRGEREPATVLRLLRRRDPERLPRETGWRDVRIHRRTMPERPQTINIREYFSTTVRSDHTVRACSPHAATETMSARPLV